MNAKKIVLAGRADGALARRSVLAGLVPCMFAATGMADTPWPSQAVRYVVPLSPGGTLDSLTRTFAQILQPIAGGQPMVVENRTGGGGTIGGAFVAAARPDGYTLFMGDIGPNIVAGEILSRPPYNPATAFTPILHVVDVPLMLVARKTLGAKTLPEVLDLAKRSPDGLTYASAGVGSTAHLTMEMLAQKTGARLVHVPYRGGGEMMTAILRGDVDLTLRTGASGLESIRSGDVQAIAVSSTRPSRFMPEIPPIAATVPGFDVAIWHGLFGPAGMSPDLVARINTLGNAAIATSLFRQGWADVQAAEVVGGSAQDFATFVRNEFAKWLPLVRAAGIRAE
jgi:tripartite-type tricarboxylate transporter receptor subunit TctC